MEAIITHSSMPRTGPKYIELIAIAPIKSVCVARVVPKAARQKARLRMKTQHTVARGDSALQCWQLAMSTCAFRSAHRKKWTAITPSHILKTFRCGLAHPIMRIYFLGGRVEGLPFFSAP